MTEIKPGDKVTYTSPHGKKENGMVKSLSGDGKAAFVVYHCNGEWSRYKDYTAARTELEDLEEGWYDEEAATTPRFKDFDSPYDK